MATGRLNAVLQHARGASPQPGAAVTDGELLKSFLARRDEAAFEVLVRRHGPMVMGVCRRVLLDEHAAEDAFQATFIVLARKAASLASPELLANWLYGVAHNTALRAKAAAVRREARERQVAEMPEPAVEVEARWADLRPVLDEELSRLPDKYRVAIVLCDLEGRTRQEAAQQLGCPEGTVAARVARGRALLASRLARRGVVLSAGALGAALARHATACVPPAVASSASRAATLLARGETVAGVVSAEAAALAEGVVKAMLVTKLGIATVVLLFAACVGVGAVACGTGADDGPAGSVPAPVRPGATPAPARDLRPAAPGETPAPVRPKETAEPEGGKPVNGLVAVAEVVERPAKAPGAKGLTAFVLRVRLKNVSDKPITVCNFAGDSPLGVRWTGPDGKAQKSNHYNGYNGVAHADVALNKDRFVVISAGGAHPIEPEVVFYPPATHEEALKELMRTHGPRPAPTKDEFLEAVGHNPARPGKHRLVVSFTNKQDGKRFGLENVWTGTVTANEVEFTVSDGKDGSAKGFRLTLSADKTESMTKDGKVVPVKLKLTFTNVTDKPLRLDLTDTSAGLNTHDVRFRVKFRCTGPSPDSVGTVVEEISRPPLKAPAEKDFPVLQPGKSWSPDWAIDFPGDVPDGPDRNVGYTLRKPGTYRLSFTCGGVESNELELTVK
jgi:RNA polymerase sigma factor (sigma-70 family)